jgi:heme exporter protein A
LRLVQEPDRTRRDQEACKCKPPLLSGGEETGGKIGERLEAERGKRAFEAYVAGLAAYDLSCQRGGRAVFDGLSFAVSAGQALLLSGPNGAGKTSLLRQIAGLLPLAAGRLSLEGASPDAELPERCHYVGHLNAVKTSFSVRENLAFWAEFLAPNDGSLDGALAGLPAGLLSAGQKRKLALSRLFTASRPIWLLDEPQVSLDAASLKLLDKALKDHLAAGGIALVASHTPLKIKFAHRLALGGKEPVA